jgi:hypothetical protein
VLNIQTLIWILKVVYTVNSSAAYKCNNQLTPRNKVLLEKLIVDQLADNSPVFYVIQEFITLLQKPATGLYPETDNSK